MSVTQCIKTGDGVNTTLVNAVVELPDSGTTLNVAGKVQYPGQPAVAITGSPLAIPANPGSGSVFWQLVVDYLTGAASVVQSTANDPPPVDRGPKSPMFGPGELMPQAAVKGRVSAAADQSTGIVILKQTLVTASPTANWQNTTTTIPNNY